MGVCVVVGRVVIVRVIVRVVVIMRMFMGVVMIVVMVVRHRIIMVVAALAVFYRKFAELASVTRHQGLGHAALHIQHALLQHLKNFPLKTEIIGRGEANGGVLGFQ